MGRRYLILIISTAIFLALLVRPGLSDDRPQVRETLPPTYFQTMTTTVTSTVYLPLIALPPPPLCTPPTGDWALHLRDFPPAIGWQLFEDTSKTPEDTRQQAGWQQSCFRTHANILLLLFGLTGVAINEVTLFDSPDNAHIYYEFMQARIPEPVSIEVPNIGDETAAYKLSDPDSEIEGHIIFFRRNTVVVSVATAAISPPANFEDTIYFAGLVKDHIDGEGTVIKAVDAKPIRAPIEIEYLVGLKRHLGINSNPK